MAGDDDKVFMTRSLNVTPKTTKQHLTVRSDKSVASVTNNRKLRSTYCILLNLKLTTDRHEALRGVFATAKLLVCFGSVFQTKLATRQFFTARETSVSHRIVSYRIYRMWCSPICFRTCLVQVHYILD